MKPTPVLVILAFVLANSATSVEAQSIALAWDPSSDPDISGYILLYGTQPGTYDAAVDAGNQTFWDFAPPAGTETYYFVVEAYNVMGVTSAPSNEVSTVSDVVPPANASPSIASPGNQSSAEGDIVSLRLTASDPDGDPISYSATGLPPALSLDSTSGVISGSLSFTSAGVYTVTVSAFDGALSGSQTFTWTVQQTNRPPTVTNPADQFNGVGNTVSLQVVAVDPDGDVLTFGATGLPPGLKMNTSTGLIRGKLTGKALGTYTVTVWASDGAQTGQASFVWTVTK